MTLGTTKIPYLDRLWHPTTGCSFGCSTCWARPLVVNRLAGTMRGLPDPPRCGGVAGDAAFAPTFHADRLADPLRARKPQVIGVSFFGDLFDPAITDEQIEMVWQVMYAAHWHTFVVLTKQAARMGRWFRRHYSQPNPVANVWIGVSVTNQADADERIPRLLRTPAAHRWVSAEPLVGPVDLHKAAWNEGGPVYSLGIQARMVIPRGEDGWWTQGFCGTRALDLVIAGGESGPQARPCAPDWARSLRDQCAGAGVAFNWKQWGPKSAGRLLDGQLHDALPWRIER